MMKGATQDVARSVLCTDTCHKTKLKPWAFGFSCINVSDIDYTQCPDESGLTINVNSLWEFLTNKQRVFGPHTSRWNSPSGRRWWPWGALGQGGHGRF
jgi:hypothetical protein